MSNLAQLSDRFIADIVRSRLSSPACTNSAGHGRDRSTRGLTETGNAPSMRELLTVREVASLLRCHPETIYRQIKTEGLPAKRHGNRWKFDPKEVAIWLDQHSAKRDISPAEDEAPGNTG